MLVAHGTNEISAKEAEKVGYFESGSYFADMKPNSRTAILSAADYAFKFHPIGQEIHRLHAQQKSPVIFSLMSRYGQHWENHYEKAQAEARKQINEGNNDLTKYVTSEGRLKVPGLVYIIDAPQASFRPVSLSESFLSTEEIVSTDRVAIDGTKNVLTSDEYVEMFKEYGHDLETLDLTNIDPLLIRLISASYSRARRLFQHATHPEKIVKSR